MALLAPDRALGEQAVEVWVGEISAAALTAAAQMDTVDGLRSALDRGGRPRLTAATSGWRGACSTATLDVALTAIRHLVVSR